MATGVKVCAEFRCSYLALFLSSACRHCHSSRLPGSTRRIEQKCYYYNKVKLIYDYKQDTGALQMEQIRAYNVKGRRQSRTCIYGNLAITVSQAGLSCLGALHGRS